MKHPLRSLKSKTKRKLREVSAQAASCSEDSSRHTHSLARRTLDCIHRGGSKKVQPADQRCDMDFFFNHRRNASNRMQMTLC
mmetsp:Transcript_9533/g.18658  ORF Transcript_9533/g.18658 Transcript_9533/m.18658 type:complete len:82 (+) Transcript_9533:2469-2714(+)